MQEVGAAGNWRASREPDPARVGRLHVLIDGEVEVAPEARGAAIV